MIDNGLMNLQTTTHLSPSLMMFMVEWAYGWSWSWKRDKDPLLVRLLHLLGAEWEQYKSKMQEQKQALRMRHDVDSHLHPVILHLHESVWPDWDSMWTQMEEELRDLIHLPRKPLQL